MMAATVDCKDRFLNLFVIKFVGFASKTKFSSNKAAFIRSRAARGLRLEGFEADKIGSEWAWKSSALNKSLLRGKSFSDLNGLSEFIPGGLVGQLTYVLCEGL